MNRQETYEHLFVGKGRVTLAVLRDGKGGVKVGISFCSPKDQFARARGRKIALGRASADSVYSYSFSEVDQTLVGNKKEAVSRFIEMATKDEFLFPAWVYRAVGRGEVCTVKELREGLYYEAMEQVLY